MPTSPQEVTGGTGWKIPAALLSNPRADVGIGPYGMFGVIVLLTDQGSFITCPLHIPPRCRSGTFSSRRRLWQ